MTLVLGKEKFLKREFLRELSVKIFSGDPNAGLNTQEFTASGDGLAGFLEFAQTAPFLASRRLAILWEVEGLSKEQQAALLSALTKIPQTTVPVLLSEESSAKKSPFLNDLSAVSKVVFCHVPFEKDLPAWIEARARRLGKRIPKDAIAALLERTGKDLSALGMSLEQLALYVHGRNSIELGDVTELLGKSAEVDVFRLVDWLLAGRTVEAFASLEYLFRGGVSGYEMAGALASQLDRLKKGLDLVETGCSPYEAAVKSGVHPFFREKFISQLRLCQRAFLARILKSLLECDEAIKTGKLPEKLALERFILEFTRGADIPA